MTNLLKDCKFLVVKNAVAAGTTTQTTSTVDMAGYDAVTFIAELGTVTDDSVLTLKAQDGTDSGGSGAADITGATTAAFTAATSSNTMIVLDVIAPQARYVTAVLTRATQNAAINCIIAILHRSKSRPVTQSATHVIASAAFECAT
jgi:hypothetical protein